MLHYTFTRFSDLKARRDRCDCAPTEEDAKRCFILPFDRMVRCLPCCRRPTQFSCPPHRSHRHSTASAHQLLSLFQQQAAC